MENKIVLDHGSYYIKYGFVGYNSPMGKLRTFKSIINNNYENSSYEDSSYEDSSYEYNNYEDNDYPIKNGIIVNYDLMCTIWDNIFFDKLKIRPKDCYLLVTDPILNGNENRKKIEHIMKNKYLFKNVTFVNQQILSLFGNGRNRGLVVDIGYDSSKIVPIYDGHILERGIVISPLCKKNMSTLDDKQILEALEDPFISNLDTESIGEAIIKSIEYSPIDLRKVLYQNILIVGGGSMIPGIGNSILKSIRKTKKIPFKIKIAAPRDRNILSWIGGSIYGSIC